MEMTDETHVRAKLSMGKYSSVSRKLSESQAVWTLRNRKICYLCSQSKCGLLGVQPVVQVFMGVRCTPGLLLSVDTQIDRHSSHKDFLLKGP
jgi:hypothetical protein